MRARVAGASTSQKVMAQVDWSSRMRRSRVCVVDTDAAVLDDDVCLGGEVEHGVDAGAGLVDEGSDVGEVVGVAVLLAAVGVGLGEGDGVAEALEVFVTAAVIGGGTVPVGGDDGGAEGEDLHESRSSQMEVSCWARWLQVWWARMVSRPRAA